MDPKDSNSSNQTPAPPTSIPPVPPTSATPILLFLQTRLETLAKELTEERNRSEDLRREKYEHENRELGEHAQARAETLEKRLDEMQKTFTSLLKDAVTQRDQRTPELLEQFRTLSVEVGRWRAELESLSRVLPEIRTVADRFPADTRRLEGLVDAKLSQLMKDVRERLEDWERHRALDSAGQSERLQTIERERAALRQAWDEQMHNIRSENLQRLVTHDARIAEQINTIISVVKENDARLLGSFGEDVSRREHEISNRLTTLASDLSTLRQDQESATIHTTASDEKLTKILDVLTATPKAKDHVITLLEAEKRDLLRALNDRNEALQRFTAERRAVEKSMGDSLMQLTAQIEEEREKTRQAETEASQLRSQTAAAADRLSEAQKMVVEREQRYAALSAERDQLTLALMAEAAKVREGVAERSASDERWLAQCEELRRKLEEESQRRAAEAAVAIDLRAQLATVAEHMTRALQEKDAVVNRFASWEKERAALLDSIRKKDEMTSLLSGTFQNMLKKQ